MSLGSSVATAIVHPRMLQSLQDFYPSEVAIQAATVTGRKPNGEQIVTWSDFLTGIRGNLAVGSATRSLLERRTATLTIVPGGWSLSLDGYYPTITVEHRAVIDGKAYNITAVHHDSLSESTRLALETVEH